MHIALDTGMGRIGFHPDENSLKEIERIAKLPGIEIEGMFTHFARADEADKAFTHLQYERYQKFHEGLEAAGVSYSDVPLCEQRGDHGTAADGTGCGESRYHGIRSVSVG